MVAGCGQQHVACKSCVTKVQITVTAACNAAGYVLPPTVVVDRKYLKPEVTTGEVPRTLYRLSSSGWMDGEHIICNFDSTFVPSSHQFILCCSFWMGTPHTSSQKRFARQQRQQLLISWRVDFKTLCIGCSFNCHALFPNIFIGLVY